MRLFQMLGLLDPGLDARRCKIHLATWNGFDDPLDVYLAGDFEEWQRWQSRKNFERDFVVALIRLPQPDRWLFAGAFDSIGQEWIEDKHYDYDLVRRAGPDELNGRLVVSFGRDFRQSYLDAERWQEELQVAALRPEALTIADFPGYSRVAVSKSQLDLIVSQQVESWKGALSNVSGVYLLSDTKTGKLYVGSALGEGGIWTRWSSYSVNGHGGNTELKALLNREAEGYEQNFHFSILEIADSHANGEDVRARESHWKEVLLTRKHGYNQN